MDELVETGPQCIGDSFVLTNQRSRMGLLRSFGWTLAVECRMDGCDVLIGIVGRVFDGKAINWLFHFQLALSKGERPCLVSSMRQYQWAHKAGPHDGVSKSNFKLTLIDGELLFIGISISYN